MSGCGPLCPKCAGVGTVRRAATERLGSRVVRTYAYLTSCPLAEARQAFMQGAKLGRDRGPALPRP